MLKELINAIVYLIKFVFCVLFIVLLLITTGISNFIEKMNDKSRANNERMIEPFIIEKDYIGAENFIIENKKYLRTTCVDLLFSEALANKKSEVLDDMMKRTSTNDDFSASKVYLKALLAYSRVGNYNSIIKLFNEYGYNKKTIARVVNDALDAKQYKTVVEVLVSAKQVDEELLPKNMYSIVSTLLSEKKYADCQKLVEDTKSELLYNLEIVREMAMNGNRSGAKNYLRSRKHIYEERDLMNVYDYHMMEANTW